MIRVMFIILFLTELLIAIIAIVKICILDIKINRFNNAVIAKRNRIKYLITDFRLVIEDFAINFENFKKYLKEKHSEYVYKLTKNIIMYSLIFALKGKSKKALLIYQLAREVYDGVQEGEFI